jgi:hypothetical protein
LETGVINIYNLEPSKKRPERAQSKFGEEVRSAKERHAEEERRSLAGLHIMRPIIALTCHE